jgi:hypothetical protein
MANWTLFDNFRLRQLNANAKNLDAGGDTIKCALVTSTRAPVTATDVNWTTAIQANEVSGTNYTAGGISLTPTQTVSLASGTVKFTTSELIKWLQNAAGFSNARYAVIYFSVADKVIAWGDLGANVGNVSGDLQITLDANGIFTSP